MKFTVSFFLLFSVFLLSFSEVRGEDTVAPPSSALYLSAPPKNQKLVDDSPLRATFKVSAPANVFQMLEMAVESGASQAYYNLVQYYVTPDNVDITKVMELLRKAAERQHYDAIQDMALFKYFTDDILALHLDGTDLFDKMREDALSGNVDAQVVLSHLNFQMLSFPNAKTYFDRAMGWAKMATDSGDPRGWYLLGSGFQTLEEGAVAMQALTIAADKGYLDAINEVAYMYITGEGVRRDHAKGMIYLGKCIERNGARCLNTAASIGSNSNVEKVRRNISYYRKSALQGHANAQNNLAILYKTGIEGVVAKDDRKAFDWSLEAAVGGDADAQYYIGESYLTGKGVEKDLLKFYRWTKIAADNEQVSAIYNLGRAYEEGLGVEVDREKSALYYYGAAQYHNIEAQYKVGVMSYKLGEFFSAYIWLSIARNNGKKFEHALIGKAKRSLSKDEIRTAEKTIENWRM